MRHCFVTAARSWSVSGRRRRSKDSGAGRRFLFILAKRGLLLCHHRLLVEAPKVASHHCGHNAYVDCPIVAEAAWRLSRGKAAKAVSVDKHARACPAESP